MSATITNEVAGSSFEISQTVHQQDEPTEAEVDVTIDITETTPEGESVEISTSGASTETPPAQPESPTYGPPAVDDRFQR